MKEVIEIIMAKVLKESFYLQQGDIEYPEGPYWYSGKSDLLIDATIVTLTTLEKILEEVLK